MPSLLITLLSIFKIAPLIVRAVGNTVRPMLMAFDRLGSSTVIVFFASAPFCRMEEKRTIDFSIEIE